MEIEAADSTSPASRATLEGVEVPILGSDKIKWIELTVPPSSLTLPTSDQPTSHPREENLHGSAASCHVIPGDPSAYLLWRIHDDSPNVIEVVELYPAKEFPEFGLRLIFPAILRPFSFIYRSEAQNTTESRYKIYAVTQSGLAYLLKLKSPSKYTAASVFPQNELVELDLHTRYEITTIAATSGCLLVGREDGFITSYQLGTLDPTARGFMCEFRDDLGIGRLWNLVSRGKAVGPVHGMVVTEIFGRKLLFAAHLDGTLRVWDLTNNTRLFDRPICLQGSVGSTIQKFCVGEANSGARHVNVGMLYGDTPGAASMMIAICYLTFSAGEKVTILPEVSMQQIHLDEGKVIDLKLTSEGLWILKEDGATLYRIFRSDSEMDNACRYKLHEDFMADQLFQDYDHPSDDIVWNCLPMFSSVKDQVPLFISSIFLRRLLQPGIHFSSALYAAVADQKKNRNGFEIESLTLPDLKQEIYSVIESKGFTASTRSILCYWRDFCSHFLRHWCLRNTPYSLFVDYSTGMIGLIRKSSISLFRQLEPIEVAIHGPLYDYNDLESSRLNLPINDYDSDIMFGVLRCVSTVNQQFGRAAAAVIYEFLTDLTIASCDNIILNILKLLNACYSAYPSLSPVSSRPGDEADWEKKREHRNYRKFSIDMLVSLHALQSKATTWDRIINAIEQYLKNLIPEKSTQQSSREAFFTINSCLLVHSTSQMAKVNFDFAVDVLILLGYMVDYSEQVRMTDADLSRVRGKIMPMVVDILIQWQTVHFITTVSTETPSVEDFSSKLSSLRIDNGTDQRSWSGKLGTANFTLAFLLDFPISSSGRSLINSTSFPNPSDFGGPVQHLCSRIAWGGPEAKTHMSPQASNIELVSLLLRHGQYEAAERLLMLMDAQSSKKAASWSMKVTDGHWSACLHLLGFCYVVRAYDLPSGSLREWKIHEAVRSFFRAACGEGASAAVQNLSFQTGLSYSGDTGSTTVWKFFYYQWAMQLFEQYKLSEAASQFALAALEQVDEVLAEDNTGAAFLPESSISVSGRLWANVFKFALDLSQYHDAYCAIISNPDEDSKYICLRRFIIVLYERGETKILCDGELPLVGLMEKFEQELVWKAERSDVSSKPNVYKLLYAFEIHRGNWRKAASYMYRYAIRLRQEIDYIDNNRLSSAFQEILCALSASINALQLVPPLHAWFSSEHGIYLDTGKSSPNKRPRNVQMDGSYVSGKSESQKITHHVDIETLDREYVLTFVQHLLCQRNVKCTVTSDEKHLINAVDALVQGSLYDMAFTVLFKFWKGSKLESELERVFVSISQKCCASNPGSTIMGDEKSWALMLPSDDWPGVSGKGEFSHGFHQHIGGSQWEVLEIYLEKYRKLHPRLPAVVAETLLYSDPEIDLPLWLVHMFKGGRRVTSWGMTGRAADPATLLRLFIGYGRYVEATNLLLEYIEAFSSMRPSDIINRKKMSAVWFPYVAVEQLWYHLEAQSSGQMANQCDRLKSLLQGALHNHLKLVKVDGDDALAAVSV